MKIYHDEKKHSQEIKSTGSKAFMLLISMFIVFTDFAANLVAADNEVAAAHDDGKSGDDSVMEKRTK